MGVAAGAGSATNAGVGGGGPARGSMDDLDNGYFPDDDAVAAPPPSRGQTRPVGNGGGMSGGSMSGAGASRGAAPRGAGAMAAGGRSQAPAQPATEARRPVEPAYPDDDYDDSDPFADQ